MKLFKLKRKNIILVSLLAIAGFLGISSVTVNQISNVTPVVKKTEAATATTVYYAVDTEYTVKCNIKYGTGSSDPWDTFTMTKVDGTYGIYKATFTDKWNGLATMQFQLYDGDTWKSEVTPFKDSWTNPSTYNNKLYYKNSWVTTFKEVKKTTTLSSSTGRVFFYNSGTHWASSGTCAVYAWGGDATKNIDSKITMEGTYYHFNWFQDDNNDYYGYADIPTNVTGYKIAKLSSSDYVGATLSYDSTNEFSCDSFGYVRYGQGSGNYISTGGAHNDVAGANLMIKVINAYNTCSSSALNGYGAYNALNESFYGHATDAAKSASTTSYNGSNMSIENHFIGMASRQGTNGQNALHDYSPFNLLGGENNFSTIIIIVSSSVALLSVTALSILVIIKRKSKED